MFENQNSQTKFNFSLPVGLLDTASTTHKSGIIRRATGADELALTKNPPTWDNPSYGVLVILSRTIVRLGDLSDITTELLEQLFLPDLNYLLKFYNAIALPEARLSLSGE
ncbi:MAG: hypothetical protein AAF652_05820 [Cyanobacteria bacterium P01_C01_bin.72]